MTKRAGCSFSFSLCLCSYVVTLSDVDVYDSVPKTTARTVISIYYGQDLLAHQHILGVNVASLGIKSNLPQ